MEKSIKRNYFYNVSYQIVLMITPLITTPYLSRVLGPEGIGAVSYAESIVAYFTFFAVLGITTYGQREISYVQDDRDKRTRVFWNTKILEIITSLIVLFIYMFFSLCQNNSILYIVLAFNIIAVVFDVTWFFQGIEEFGKIVLRNFFFKILNIVFIFAFIKKADDFVLYAFGLAFFLFAGNLSLWVYLPRFVNKPTPKELKPFCDLKTVLSLFIPTIAIQIYTVLDKTMIGLLTQDVFENGYYEQAIKMARLVLTIVTSLGTVMIPRIGFHYKKGATEVVNSFMYKSYRFVWLAGIPFCLLLIGVSPNFVPWFFGVKFLKVVPLLEILSFLILAIGINNVTGMQYLIPTNRQNMFTFTVIVGAITNFILNLVLIPHYKALGAAIASVAAETVIAILQLYLVRDDFSVKKVFFSCRNYLISGVLMIVVLKLMDLYLSPSIIHTFIMGTSGVLVYVGMLFVIKDDFFMENSLKILSKIKM